MTTATYPSPGRIKIYQGVPKHVLPGLVRFVENGYPTGSFLRSVLINDLEAACSRADDICGPALQDIVRFLYNAFPGGAWTRSEEGHLAWMMLEDEERLKVYTKCPNWIEFKLWYDEQEDM